MESQSVAEGKIRKNNEDKSAIKANVVQLALYQHSQMVFSVDINNY